MCLAVPVRIIEILQEQGMAIVSLEGVKQKISIALLDDVSEGDYVLVHVGYALNKLSPEEAEKTLQLFEQAGLINQSG